MPGGAGSLPRPVLLLRAGQPALEVGDPGTPLQPRLLVVPGRDHRQLHRQRGQVSPRRVHLRPRAPQGTLDLELWPDAGQPQRLPSVARAFKLLHVCRALEVEMEPARWLGGPVH